MKILCGTDLVYIPRIAGCMERSADAFINKCYTAKEAEYARSFKSPLRTNEILAGRFAAKEAVSKALGTGILSGGISLTDLEILSDGKGAPYIKLHNGALEKAKSLHVVSSSVSISHEKDYAQAFCVLLCDGASA